MGGSSGGSSGSSGQIDYPSYMKDRHSPLYDRVLGKIETAEDNNPYTQVNAFNPSPFLAIMGDVMEAYEDKVEAFDPVQSFQHNLPIVVQSVEQLLQHPAYDGFIEERQRLLDDKFYHTTLPNFRAGMRDNGAYMTSAYKIGEALLYAQLLAEQAGIQKEIDGKIAGALLPSAMAMAERLTDKEMQMLEVWKNVTHYWLEQNRMSISAMLDYAREQQELRYLNATWQLELEKYAMDALGSISGSAGAANNSGRQSSKITSAIGGALSGASTGAAIGTASGVPGLGTLVGGALGALSGLL